MTSRTTPTITTTLTTTTYRATFSLDEVDGLDHVEAQLDAAVGVVGPGHRKSGHAVVAITQQLDPKTVTHLKTTEKNNEKNSNCNFVYRSSINDVTYFSKI